MLLSKSLCTYVPPERLKNLSMDENVTSGTLLKAI